MKVIGLDVDGTLAAYTGWRGIDKIGVPLHNAKEFVALLKKDGWTVCLWSTRADVYVLQWARQYGIEFDYINASPYAGDSLKQSFDVYLGDEAIRFDGSFNVAYREITELGKTRHWGSDTFERNRVESDRNPEPYYRGTGKLYLDIFDGLTERLWSTRDVKDTAFLTICSHAKPYSKSWIHTEIKKRLYVSGIENVDYVHISSAGIIPADACHSESIVNRYDWNGAEIQDPEVTTMLRERIKSRLLTWYELAGRYYTNRLVYLRPTGNTLRAVQETGLPITVLPVTEYPSPPWMDFPDVDDCLADFRNLQNIRVP